MYRPLEKVAFSTENYHELLDLYNKQVRAYRERGLKIPDSSIVHKGLEQKILGDVACEWLNKVEITNRKISNYHDWDILGPSKRELYIAGIFPMTGTKYVARELVPGIQFGITLENTVWHIRIKL